MNKVNCPKFDDCAAPLCPLQQNTVDSGIWYPDEEICRRRGVPDWIRKQKAIVKVKAPSYKYFTVAMLQSVRQVRKGIEGINPDQPIKQAEEAERRWIMDKKGSRVVAKQNQKPRRVVPNKKSNLVYAGKTTYGKKGAANDA